MIFLKSGPKPIGTKKMIFFLLSQVKQVTFYFRPSFPMWYLVVLKYLHRVFQNCLQEVVVVEVVVEEEQLTPPKRPCILKNQLCRMEADIEICLQFFLYVNIGHRDFSRTVLVCGRPFSLIPHWASSSSWSSLKWVFSCTFFIFWRNLTYNNSKCLSLGAE